MPTHRGIPLFAVIALLSVVSHPARSASVFVQTNLVSDIPGLAVTTDPSLVNPWGLAFSATSPFWIADNGTGLSTLYNGAGTKIALTVTVPPGSSSPTGLVFNGGASFAGSRFIFSTEQGTIAAWTSGTAAVQTVDNSAGGAVYKGLAIGNNGSGDFLYATNFSQGRIDVFNSIFAPAAGFSFTDPNVPTGFAPFGIENIAGTLYVTYAQHTSPGSKDDSGVGGFVDAFDLNGNFIRRVTSTGLNSPWGLALAPSSFDQFAGDLLVGNFGDGSIDAVNPLTGAILGKLRDPNGNVIVNEGLWALKFGNNGQAGNSNTLYLTAGIAGGGNVEDHGLFAAIAAVPEPATMGAMLIGIGALAGYARRARSKRYM
jgi:uncharacterized protein (TIGR03118 family)